MKKQIKIFSVVCLIICLIVAVVWYFCTTKMNYISNGTASSSKMLHVNGEGYLETSDGITATIQTEKRVEIICMLKKDIRILWNICG